MENNQKNIKILVLDVGGRGGHAHHIFFMCNALAQIGAQVVLITTKNHEMDLRGCSFSYREVLKPHYEKKSSLTKGLTYLMSLVRFMYWVRREKPDLVHLHDFKVPFMENRMINYFHRKHVRVICSAHNVMHHEKKRASGGLKRLYNNYDAIIAHAEENKQKLVQIFGVLPEKIQVIPVGEYSFIAHTADDKIATRKALGISSDRKVLLFFGYIRKYKGLSVLLNALHLVRSSVPEVFLIIAGEPKEDYSRYEHEIESLGITDCVFSEITYIPLQEMSKYFAASDVVVLPYTNIYQSGILYLAFAHKRAVIASAVGGLPEVIEEGKSGFLVPANDPQKLAQTIAAALADVDKLMAMGEYAFNQAKHKYSWEDIAEKTLVLYKKIIDTDH